MTVEELVRKTSDVLIDKGYVHGEREANFIICSVVKEDSAWLISNAEDSIDDETVGRVNQLTKIRLKGCPLAYILKEQPFLGWRFIADKRGLIPRPETEYLVEKLVKEIKEFSLQEGRFLEIGTGSGPISICLKKYFPYSQVTATDISEDALELAQENAKNLEVDIDFLEGNLFDPVKKQKYQLVVANLPYVPTGKLSFISSQILDWEPMMAIEAGKDGLKYIAPFIKKLSEYLSPTGIAAIEMWHTHGPDIVELAKKFLPSHEVVIEKDLASYDRYALFLPLKT